MPEYLAPGVFIEEIPATLKAIEGVSTSTAGMVGAAERGAVPGLPLPFTPVVNPLVGAFVFPSDPAPLLVTSFSEFTREFGGPLPLPDPNDDNYLSRAVKGFFDNGGKRCFVSRVVEVTNVVTLATSASNGQIQVSQGTVLRLARRARPADPTVLLTSLRRVSNLLSIDFRSRSDNSSLFATSISGFDTARNEVTLAAPIPGGVTLDPNETYVIVNAAAPVSPGSGPTFWARSPGAWSSRVTVLISNADRGPVPAAAPAVAAATQVQVQSTASFYRGAVVEITDGTDRVYNEIHDILPGNRLQLENPIGLALGIGPPNFVRAIEIDVTVSDESGAVPIVETYRALSWNPRNNPEIRRRHYSTPINANSRLVYVLPPDVGGGGSELPPGIDNQPVNFNGFPTGITTAGGDGNPPGPPDFVGVDNGPGLRTGIEALQDIEDVRIIAAPGQFDSTVHNALISQCERMRYRFAILDPDHDSLNVNQILADRNLYDSSFAALYVPWLEVSENGQRLRLPPSGHVAGIYARSDVERGVGKAPANEVVRGIVGLQTYITTGEQEVLNPHGVNCIRRFEGRGLRVWGARTLSSDPEFRYVNVRRVLIFLEASIDRGTQYVVFEPNLPSTWSRVVDSVSAFLNTQWRNGLLFGRRPEDSFFVRCDETTMSADDIQGGRLICVIGVAIVRPAEFVIFRIQQITGFANQP